MQGFNHIAGGYAFTGLFCSFADLNIFDSPITLAVVGAAALLPDVDHTKSLIGKSVFPLASWLSRNYGHRTVTHSIFFFAAVVCIAQVIDNLFHLHYTLPIALALASHLIFDMCTKQGIPLFYPFSRRPVVLPANPRMRLSANDYRSEAVIFVLFCCLNLFSMPLMASGFWTRYNKSFATFEHLAREAKRKPGDYQITYLNPDNDTITATVVQQKSTDCFCTDPAWIRKGRLRRSTPARSGLFRSTVYQPGTSWPPSICWPFRSIA